MYTCSNCGAAFDGRVCPKCCTMRPAAAVLGRSGQILKNRTASTLDPNSQAEQFADDLEYSRQVDAWRQEQQRRADEARQRAAKLAKAAERQQKKDEPEDIPEEPRGSILEGQVAEGWTPKAPGSRNAAPDEEKIQIPDALRSLRITTESKPAEKPKERTRAEEVKNTVSAETKDDVRMLAYPAGAKIPERKGSSIGRVSARSERIDDAWRAFATGQKAGGNADARPVTEPGQDSAAGLPKPPPPGTKK